MLSLLLYCRIAYIFHVFAGHPPKNTIRLHRKTYYMCWERANRYIFRSNNFSSSFFIVCSRIEDDGEIPLIESNCFTCNSNFIDHNIYNFIFVICVIIFGIKKQERLAASTYNVPYPEKKGWKKTLDGKWNLGVDTSFHTMIWIDKYLSWTWKENRIIGSKWYIFMLALDKYAYIVWICRK